MTAEVGDPPARPGGIPGTMRRFEIRRFKAPPEPVEVPVPRPGPGEVLVRMEASVVSHLDRTVAGGEFALQPTLPYVPGSEGAGRVALVGESVQAGLAVGTPVRVYGGGLGIRRPGTWAEYSLAPEKSVEPVPESLSPSVAAACGSVASTAWAATMLVGALQPGESLGVTGGLGAVGSLAVQLGTRHGAGKVSAWVRRPEGARLLPPGTEILGPDDGAPCDPVDLLVDTVGGPALPERLHSVRAGGRAVLVGYAGGETLSLSLPNLMAADVALLPLNMMRRRPPPEVLAELLGEFVSGALVVAIERVVPDDLPGAFDRLGRGKVAGRVVVEW